MQPPKAAASSLPSGLTYRKVDYWGRRGYLNIGAPGSGRRREYPEVELQVATWMYRLTEAGLEVVRAAELARDIVTKGRQTVELGPGLVLAVVPLPELATVDASAVVSTG